jgi:cellulose synthase/poly-beta-1,6-N-acetylglucosamine synthase-like glycosyltransferase
LDNHIDGPQKIAMVIFAQNESSVIQKTVGNIKQGLRAGDALFVVVDNSNDDTASIAKKAGAKVMIREAEHPQGKGAALKWFMENYREQIGGYDCLVILDADSLIPLDFIDQLCLNWNTGIRVAQCFLSPIGYDGAPLSTLIALSEIVEQTVFDRIRSFLKLSVRLRGTGMVFTPQFLSSLSQRLDTEVEDIALSLLAAERKVIIRSFQSVIVFDPKPTDRAAASRQRARWYRGQWAALWKYRVIVFKLLFRGPAGWSVLNSLFLKPRWMKILFLLILGLVFLPQPVIPAIAFSLAGFDMLLILAGILVHPDRSAFLRSLVFIPVFILMWMKGILLSLRRRPWLRVREGSKIKENPGSGQRLSVDSTDSHFH